MSKYYLTVVYEVDGAVAARTILDARPWKASSHSNAIHDCNAARLEIESLHAQLEAIGAGEPLRKRPVFGRPGTRDVDVAAAQRAWDAAQAKPVRSPPAWWRKRADEIEADVARGGSIAAMNCYTNMRQLLQAATEPQPAAQALDAIRYQFLRDGEWRDTDLEPFIRLQLNTLWDAKIDAAIAAKQGVK